MGTDAARDPRPAETILARCRCPRFGPDGPRCQAVATQEDLLCNDCRHSKVEFAVKSWPYHMRGESVTLSREPPG